MKPFLAAVALFVVSLSARASDFERTLSVSSQPDLYVSTNSGTIHVFAGHGGQMRIVGHVHGKRTWDGGNDDVRARIARIVANPPVTQSGNAVRVGDTENRRLYNDIIVDYEVTVPEAAALNLRSGSGDLQVDGVGRFLAAATGSGTVRAHQLHGPADLRTGSGDVELEETTSGDVKAQTGSGSIRVHGLNGGLQAHSGSGDVECDGRLAGMSRLESGSGSMRLHLTPDSHFQLQASTGSGAIRIHIPGQDTETDSHHVSMTVNGGGVPVDLHTGSGDIEVTPR